MIIKTCFLLFGAPPRVVVQRQTRTPGEDGGVTLCSSQAHEVLHKANQHAQKVSLAPGGPTLLGDKTNFEN